MLHDTASTNDTARRGLLIRAAIRSAFFLALAVLLPACSTFSRPSRPSEENEFKLVLRAADHDTLLKHFQAKGAVETAAQENFYFDTRGGRHERFLLKRNGINVRLRTKGETVIMTVKVNCANLDLDLATGERITDNLRTLQEFECFREGGFTEAQQIRSGGIDLFTVCRDWAMTDKSTNHPVAVLEKLLARGLLTSSEEKVFLEKEAITCVGQNKTIRSSIPATLGGVDVLIELDKTYFPTNHVGYVFDVEVEETEAEESAKADLKHLFSDLHLPYKPAQAGKQAITFFILEEDPEKLAEMKDYGTIYPVSPVP